MAETDSKTIIQEFRAAVNMSPKTLESWLQTEESQRVGQKNGEAESIGHQSGRRIIHLLQMKASEYQEEDLAHMRKVVSYIHRHSAQRPKGDVEETPWRYSLMNWGHDPLN